MGKCCFCNYEACKEYRLNSCSRSSVNSFCLFTVLLFSVTLIYAKSTNMSAMNIITNIATANTTYTSVLCSLVPHAAIVKNRYKKQTNVLYITQQQQTTHNIL